ncbi:MAG: RnfABCDGE type electron transport complex subunit D [Magnetococcus sp. WYHC-3]
MNQPSLAFDSSPHVHGGASVSQVMRQVIYALLPATGVSVLLFGWPALLVILITTASAMVFERLVNHLRGRESTVGDNSAALTGLLLALTLPPYAPWWIGVVGAFFAVVIAKQLYGGLGYNMFNPALIARVFLLISFPVQLTTWPAPNPLFSETALSIVDAFQVIFASGHYFPTQETWDAITAATPLGQYRMETSLGHTVAEALGGDYHFSLVKAANGVIGGSLGETSALVLLAGGLWMLHRKVITWHIPVSTLLGCLLPALVFWLIDGNKYPDPLFHLLTGGLILGAFFMATDMVTSPVTFKGQLIFGAACGLLTYVIRTWGGFPEGISFAIVIMNSAVPLINQYTPPKIYGERKPVGKK